MSRIGLYGEINFTSIVWGYCNARCTIGHRDAFNAAAATGLRSPIIDTRRGYYVKAWGLFQASVGLARAGTGSYKLTCNPTRPEPGE